MIESRATKSQKPDHAGICLIYVYELLVMNFFNMFMDFGFELF
jgi:hypothetical protein